MVALCFGCKDAPATLWCEVCSMLSSGYLCSECDLHEHSTHTGQLHHRITLEEKALRTSLEMKCNTHTEQGESGDGEENVYCGGCRCPICMAVHKYAETVRAELKECLRPLGDTQFLVDMKNALAAEQKRNKKELAELEKRMREVEQTIEKNKHTLHEIDERKEKFGMTEMAIGRVIEQMGVLELADGDCVNEMKCRIERLVEDLCGSDKAERERMQNTKLNSAWIKVANKKTCTVSTDGYTFTKTHHGHCSISSTGPATHWRVRYDGPTEGNTQGWVLLGVHSDPANATENSYCDKECFGVSVTAHGNKNNGVWKGGAWQHVNGTLTVAVGDVICAEVVANQLTVRMENGAWAKTIDLPAGRTWYPHFNPFAASFSLLP